MRTARLESRCPLCDAEHATAAFDIETVRRCSACAFVWTRADDHRTAPAAYDETFFSNSHYYTAYFTRGSQWRHEALLRLRWLLTFARPESLLEIGCGGGFFLEAAREAGIAVHGIEPAGDGADFARRNMGLDVTSGLFENVVPPGRFDTVCAFHVLEHVEDPDAFLAKARDILPERGWLALEVPNIESTRARRDGSEWFNLVPQYHLWHFSPRTLTRIVEEAGFALISVDTVFPRHYFRARRLLTRSGFTSALADWRSSPSPARSHPSAGDLLRLIASR